MKKRDIPFSQIVGNIFIAYGVSVLWAIMMIAIIGALVRLVGSAEADLIGPLSVTPYWFSQALSLIREAHPGMYAILSQSTLLMVFMKLVFAPFVEEAAFRYFPLTLAKNMEWVQIQAIIFVVGGLVFGILHGHVLNIFIQGAIGVILGYLYVRNYRSGSVSYLSCVAVHMLYNFTVLMAQHLA